MGAWRRHERREAFEEDQGLEHDVRCAVAPGTSELVDDPAVGCEAQELRRERSDGQLVEHLGMNQPAVSKQLRVLRESGLATVRVAAQRRIYRLDPEGLREVDEWLAPFRVCWEERLDDMERTLDSMED